MGNAPPGVPQEPHHLFIGPGKVGRNVTEADVRLARAVTNEINRRGHGWSAELVGDEQKVPPDAFFTLSRFDEDNPSGRAEMWQYLLRGRLRSLYGHAFSYASMEPRLHVVVVLNYPGLSPYNRLQDLTRQLDLVGFMRGSWVLSGRNGFTEQEVNQEDVISLVDKLLRSAERHPAPHSEVPAYTEGAAPAYVEPPPDYTGPAASGAGEPAGPLDAAREAAERRLVVADFQVMNDLVLYPHGGVAGRLTEHGDIVLGVSDFLALHPMPKPVGLMERQRVHPPRDRERF